jgi:hypothetical protein
VDKRGRGRPEIGPVFEVRLTGLQRWFLRLSAAASNESAASVLRRLIRQELQRQLLQEVINGRGKHPQDASDGASEAR